MSLPNTRMLSDAALTITKALPSTSSNNTTDYIDLGAAGFKPEEITIEITIPAIAAHVTAGNVPTITLYDSASTSGAAVTDPQIQTSWIGVITTGSLGKTVRFKLPPGTKRYIAFYQTTGGTDDLSGSSITYKILN